MKKTTFYYKSLNELIKAKQERQNFRTCDIAHSRLYLFFKVFSPNGQYTEETHLLDPNQYHNKINDLIYKLKADGQDVTTENIILKSLMTTGGTLPNHKELIKQYLKYVSY